MILATQTTMAVLCPECGEIEFKALSLFAFSQKKRETLTCQCGAQLLTVASNNRKQFSLAYGCAFCGNTHYLRLQRKAIWNKGILELTCPEMGSIVGYIGTKTKVAQAWQEQKKTMLDLIEEGFGEEYENAEAMLEVLDHLHDLAKKGGLECGCGNHHLSYDLLADRVEIYCECCEALGIIYTDSSDNIQTIKRMNSLVLEENKTSYFNHPVRGLPIVKTIKEE